MRILTHFIVVFLTGVLIVNAHAQPVSATDARGLPTLAPLVNDLLTPEETT